MKRERKRRMRTIQRVGESFSDGGEEFKARRLCNRSGDRAMEHAAGHPLKRERKRKADSEAVRRKCERLRNDNGGALGGQRARGWRDLRYKSGVEPPQSK